MDVIVSSQTVVKYQKKSTYKRIGINVFSFIFLLLFSFSINAKDITSSNMSEIKQTIEQFLKILDKNNTPTLKDYQWMMGYSDFPELQLFWKHCYTKLDSAPLRDQNCYNELTKNWIEKDKAPSYYLRWLQNQLPENPEIVIQFTKLIKYKNVNIGINVKANLNDITVTFWIPINDDISRVGNIHVASINGIPINALRKKSSNASILFALGLKRIVRPQTSEERNFENKRRNDSCSKSAECMRLRKKRNKLFMLHKEEMDSTKKIMKKYKVWCVENLILCEKEKVARQNNVDEVWGLDDDCKLNFKKCIPQVEVWYKKNKLLENTFCKENGGECNILSQIRYNQKERNKEDAFVDCNKNTSDCSKETHNFNSALEVVKKKFNE